MMGAAGCAACPKPVVPSRLVPCSQYGRLQACYAHLPNCPHAAVNGDPEGEGLAMTTTFGSARVRCLRRRQCLRPAADEQRSG